VETLARNVPVLAEDENKRQTILDTLANGGTLLQACADIGLNRSAVLRFRQKDEAFDDLYRAAWVMGIEIKMEESEIKLRAATTRDEIMAADKQMRHDEWSAEKLLPHYQPRQKLEVSHEGPMVIGWDTGPSSCPKCGWNMDAVNENIQVIDHVDAEIDQRARAQEEGEGKKGNGVHGPS